MVQSIFGLTLLPCRPPQSMSDLRRDNAILSHHHHHHQDHHHHHDHHLLPHVDIERNVIFDLVAHLVISKQWGGPHKTAVDHQTSFIASQIDGAYIHAYIHIYVCNTDVGATEIGADLF